MSMNNKTVRVLVCAALTALCLYNGTACLATLHEALRQPCLLSAAERIDFLGYYMLSALHAVLCLAALVLFIRLFLRRRK
mgnify:FL=1